MKRIHSLFLFLIAIISFQPGCKDSPVDPAPVLTPAPKLLPKLAFTALRTADSIQLFKERPSSSIAAQQHNSWHKITSYSIFQPPASLRNQGKKDFSFASNFY